MKHGNLCFGTPFVPNLSKIQQIASGQRKFQCSIDWQERAGGEGISEDRRPDSPGHEEYPTRNSFAEA
jgi:hypothetical protein